MPEITRTNDVLIVENCRFDEMLLSEALTSQMTSEGFIYPSPIQLKTIPMGRLGADLIAQGKSGTGKTLAFLIIILESILLTDSLVDPQALVLAPSREIVFQIYEAFKRIGAEKIGAKVHLSAIGVNFSDDVNAVRGGCHILVGTPGRVYGLMEKNILRTDALRIVVLDEADYLLSTGFRNDLRGIFMSMSERKQILAFSATYTNELQREIGECMRSAQFITIRAENDQIEFFNANEISNDCERPEVVVLEGVKQFWTVVPSEKGQWFSLKTKKLQHILRTVPFRQCIVFFNDPVKMEELTSILKQQGESVAMLSAAKSPIERTEIMSQMQKLKIRILVASDLISRGVDFPQVNMVINFAIPIDRATYLHRIGRTGRFGTHGIAISLLSYGEKNRFFEWKEFLENSISKLPRNISELSNFLYPSSNTQSNTRKRKRN